MTPTELSNTVAAIAEEHSLTGKWTELADTLNFLGVNTLRGRTWTPVNLRNFMTRYAHTVPQSHTVTRDAPQENTAEHSTGDAHTVSQEHTSDLEISDQGPCHTGEHTSTQVDLSHVSTQCETPGDPDVYAGVPQEHTEDSVLPTHTAVISEPEKRQNAHGLTDEPVIPEHTVSHTTDRHTTAHRSTQPETSHMRTQRLTEPDITPLSHTSAQGNTEQDVAQENTPVTQIPTDMLAELREMLDWWREQRGSAMQRTGVGEERPAFKRGRTVTKTVRLSDAMAREAERYAMKHRFQTGGTFSGLVELLVWRALGQPEKYVAHENTLSDNDTE